MKTAPKPSAAATLQRKAIQPFFGKGGTGAFMGSSPFIQVKLTVGQPNDSYEREADQMADHVVQRLAQSSASFAPNFPTNNDAPLNLAPPSIQAKCADCEAEEQELQRKELSVEEPTVSPSVESQLSVSKGIGSPLPDDTRQQMEGSMGVDFSGVRVHTDSSAVRMSQDLNAHAFTHGSDIYFNSGQYNPGSSGGQHLLAHELTHTVQQGTSRQPVQRREFGPLEDTAQMQPGDWAYPDRLNKTDRWQEANAYNLEHARSRQYMQIDQRRDFYLWFYETMRGKGYEIRWPLAAYVVAGGANEVANRDPAGYNMMRGNRLEQLMRRGNQVIFDDVFPKLRRLFLTQQPLTGAAAQAWDMQTLIEEQNLVQPMYRDLTPDEINTMAALAKQKGFLVTVGSYIFGKVAPGAYNQGGQVPPFPADYDLSNPTHRFRYGMMLAHYFTSVVPDATVSRAWAEALPVPEASAEYTNGEMLKKYDRFNNLHALSSVISDTASTVDEIKQAVYALTDEERQVALTDPWFTTMLRVRHGMSMIEAQAILSSENIANCGPLFQVIGFIEGTGMATEDNHIIVWLRQGSSWTTFSGQDRVQVQAVSDTAYQLFTGVPLRYVWVSSLHCYPKHTPLPPTPPIERTFSVFFDTNSARLVGDSNEWSNREVLNDVLQLLQQYGSNATVLDIRLALVGNASPRWRFAGRSTAAAENQQLSTQRAEHVRSYIMNAYQQYQGPVPMVVINPTLEGLAPENSTSASSITTEGRGSEEGLAQTADPTNNDQQFRRVDIQLTVLFDNNGL